VSREKGWHEELRSDRCRGGTARLGSAAGAVSLGASVALAERDRLGGDCLYRGCVPTKTLVKSTRVAHLMGRSEEYGIQSPVHEVILTSIFAERTGDLEEAARTLGATPWQTFLHVTLPGVAVAGLFAFLISWGQYILTVLIGGGNVVTLPMLLFSAASGNDPIITSALALVFALPAVLALVIALRYLKPSAADEGRGFVGLGKVS
jgi:hypothetical protein